MPRFAWHAVEFVRRADGRRSDRLEPLVRSGEPIDVEHLGALLLASHTGALTRTPFVDVAREEPSGEVTGLDAIDDEPRRLAEKLRAHLEGSVARAMAGARRVAVMAGGGVYSSTLLALAVQEARRRGDVEVIPVALDYEGPGDDRPHLAMLAEHLGVSPLRISPSQAGPLVASTLVVDAAPSIAPTLALEVALGQAARHQGAEVVLSGVGGDDLFDGFPTAFARLFHRSPWVALRSATALSVPWPMSMRSRLLDWLVRPTLGPYLPRRARELRRRRVFRSRYPWAGPTLSRAIDEVGRIEPVRLASPRDRFARFATSPHLFEVANVRSQFEVAAGVRRVDPFLDDEVVRFVVRLPMTALMYGNRLRGLFREASRGLVPDSVRLRSDKASLDPALATMIQASGGFAALRRFAGVERLATVGLVDAPRFRKALEALIAEPDGGEWVPIWRALAVESFLREWM